MLLGGCCDSFACCFKIGKEDDSVDFAGFDQRSDTRPDDTAFVVAFKECVLAIEINRPVEISNLLYSISM